MDATENKYLGTGIGFPIELDNGSAKILGGKELIKLSIPGILCWAYSQRYFMGEYGSKWEKLLEKPLDFKTASLVRTFVVEAISTYETRIELLEANVFSQDEKLFVYLKYKIRLNSTEDSFIIPFYNIIRS
jgi:uncharacterized protein